MAKAPFVQPLRGLLQSLAVLVVIGMLAVPVTVVALSDTATTDPLWTTLRIAALIAFTIVFVNIVVGSFRVFFNRLARPRLVLRIHRLAGITGLAVALAHGVSVFVFGLAGYDPVAIWVGPSALAVLAGVIAVALVRAPFKGTWRWIHRLNYVIFVAVLVHGLILGLDLRSSLLLKVWAGVYAAVVVWGLIRRVVRSGNTRNTRNTTRK